MEPHEKYIRERLEESIFNAKYGDEPICGDMTLTEVLCFVLGWQGGTIHLVAKELGVPVEAILEADYPTMGWLCRLAQAVVNRNPLASRETSADCKYAALLWGAFEEFKPDNDLIERTNQSIIQETEGNSDLDGCAVSGDWERIFDLFLDEVKRKILKWPSLKSKSEAA